MEPLAAQPRRSARALLISPDRQILLMKIRSLHSGRGYWITPGGGLQTGEEPVTALQRELFEETGLADAVIGRLVWRRRHQFQMNGVLVDQSEEFFLCMTERYEPRVVFLEEGYEQESFQELRWWPIDEISRSAENFVPAAMHRNLTILLGQEVPEEPWDVGH